MKKTISSNYPAQKDSHRLETGETWSPKGLVFVSVVADISGNYRSGTMHCTPARARKIARAILKAADAAEKTAAKADAA